MTRTRRLCVGALVLTAGAASTACGGARSPSSAGADVGSGGGAFGSAPVPTPTSTTTLGGTCDTVLPLATVDQAAGTAIVGKTSFIVSQPDASIGQVERLNCRYGIDAVAPGSEQTDTKVEVSISLYTDDAQAQARVSDTETEWRAQGAQPRTVTVSGYPAIMLTGNGKPLLVLAAGPRTVAVTLTAAVVGAADEAMIAIASAGLRGVGG